MPKFGSAAAHVDSELIIQLKSNPPKNESRNLDKEPKAAPSLL